MFRRAFHIGTYMYVIYKPAPPHDKIFINIDFIMVSVCYILPKCAVQFVWMPHTRLHKWHLRENVLQVSMGKIHSVLYIRKTLLLKIFFYCYYVFNVI